MALTYRKVKGSALTIDELDANFAHFTGSHSITGSLTVSGSIIPSEVNGTLGTATAPWKELFVDGGTIYFISGSSSGSLGWSSGSGFNFGTGSVTFDGGLTVTGSLIVSGSTNSVFDIDGFDLQITGGLDVSRDVAVRDDLTVYDDTNLRKDVNIGFRDDNPGFGYSLAVTQSTNTSGSAKFIGGITMETLPTTEPNVTGSLWISGSSLSHPNSGYLMIFNP
jgi:hypothetical protein